MTVLFYIAIPFIISSLGFMSYKHYADYIKIDKILHIIINVILAILLLWNLSLVLIKLNLLEHITVSNIVRTDIDTYLESLSFPFLNIILIYSVATSYLILLRISPLFISNHPSKE